MSLTTTRMPALLVLDLDRFKDVNDSYGHSAGDTLLQQVAERLTNRLRGADTVTRLGGDEFAVLLEEILAQPQDAARVAMDIIGILSEPWRLANDAEVRLGAGLGIGLFPEHGRTTKNMLQQADAALYQAKSEGQGPVPILLRHLTPATVSGLNWKPISITAIAEVVTGLLPATGQMSSGRIVG